MYIVQTAPPNYYYFNLRKCLFISAAALLPVLIPGRQLAAGNPEPRRAQSSHLGSTQWGHPPSGGGGVRGRGHRSSPRKLCQVCVGVFLGVEGTRHPPSGALLLRPRVPAGPAEQRGASAAVPTPPARSAAAEVLLRAVCVRACVCVWGGGGSTPRPPPPLSPRWARTVFFDAGEMANFKYVINMAPKGFFFFFF